MIGWQSSQASGKGTLIAQSDKEWTLLVSGQWLMGRGQDVTISWLDTRRAFWYGGARVVSSQLDQRDTKLTVTAPVEIAQVQRRQNVRVPVILPVTVTAEGQALRGETFDLSGGGLGFSLPGTRLETDKVTVRLVIESQTGPFVLESGVEILRVIDSSDPVTYGGRFVKLGRKEEQILTQYVFRCQLAAREETRRSGSTKA